MEPPGRDPGPSGVATRLLRASREEGAGRSEELLRLLYDELHRLAQRHMSGERTDHTLQPTALLNEVWIKLFEGAADGYRDRRHFLAVAARAMRQILVDHARAREREKRGGAWKRVELADEPGNDLGGESDGEIDLVELDHALEQLRRHSPRHAQVVECRYFAELSVADTAEALEISERTVARDWRFARAWLSNALENAHGEQSGA